MKKLYAFILTIALIFSFAPPVQPAEAIEISADAETLAAFSALVTPAILTHRDELDISGLSLTSGQLSSVFQVYCDLEPLSFPLASHYSFSYNPTTSLVKTIFLSYKDVFGDEDDIAAGLSLFNSAVDEIIEGIHGDWTEEALLVYVLNYLCSRYTYDYSYAVSDVYNFVLKKTGVCQAFTLFTAGVLRKAGIEYDTVVSRSLNHIWNRVKLGGVWYHIDFTWADSNSEGIVNYDYFLRGEDYFRSNHINDSLDWTCQTDPADAGEDVYYTRPFLWYGSKSPFVYSGGFWYYVAVNSKTRSMELMRTEDFIAPETVLTVADGKWYKSSSRTFYYAAAYSSVALSGRYVLFNTPSKLMAYDPLTGSASEIYDISASHAAPEFIYGFVTLSEYDIRLVIRNAPVSGSDHDESLVTYIDLSVPDRLRLSPAETAVRQAAVYSQKDGTRFILGLPSGTAAGDVANALAAKIYPASGEGPSLSATAMPGTGARLLLGNTEYRLVITGDVDGDGVSGEADSIYLLKALLSGDEEAFPVLYRQDFNGDGAIDTDDAVYLLKYSLNSELYPISPK
ncbi:MAG: hypothetical protein IKX06_01265 [Clostridia bacterium]|nr:hypothetical protein [Clostridia bacterium]